MLTVRVKLIRLYDSIEVKFAMTIDELNFLRRLQRKINRKVNSLADREVTPKLKIREEKCSK